MNLGFLFGSAGKEFAYNAGDTGDAGSILGSGRSPEERNDKPLQHSYMSNPMDKGAWQVTVHGVAKES